MPRGRLLDPLEPNPLGCSRGARPAGVEGAAGGDAPGHRRQARLRDAREGRRRSGRHPDHKPLCPARRLQVPLPVLPRGRAEAAQHLDLEVVALLCHRRGPVRAGERVRVEGILALVAHQHRAGLHHGKLVRGAFALLAIGPAEACAPRHRLLESPAAQELSKLQPSPRGVPWPVTRELVDVRTEVRMPDPLHAGGMLVVLAEGVVRYSGHLPDAECCRGCPQPAPVARMVRKGCRGGQHRGHIVACLFPRGEAVQWISGGLWSRHVLKGRRGTTGILSF
mmetsp:Transcript_9693/g.28622  ORF Transcript_9693/g.28622 Transcript_9693/m.28622 type:complete len:280 (+) Transcript_9693:464-1303(+)